MAAFIERALAKDACVVFSKSYCPFCVKVKNLLNSLSAKYVAYELDNMDDGSTIQAELGKITGGTSVPRVFINKQFIGGCDDTIRLHSKNGLVPLLKDAGAL